MRICIDSCTFVHGLQESDPAAVRLLNFIGPELILVVPRLVAQEVTRNLHTLEQVRRFYQLFHAHDFAFMVDEPVPRPLVIKYVDLGLSLKPMPLSASLLSGCRFVISSLTIATFCAICTRTLLTC